jgi:hypothetical protein
VKILDYNRGLAHLLRPPVTFGPISKEQMPTTGFSALPARLRANFRANPSIIVWIACCAAILALAFVVRYLWIEQTSMGLACAAVPAPWWCAPRTAVISVHQYNGWGLVALAGGIATLLFRWRWAAALGLGAGLLGLVLYNTGLAAVGLLLALLRLLRA